MAYADEDGLCPATSDADPGYEEHHGACDCLDCAGDFDEEPPHIELTRDFTQCMDDGSDLYDEHMGYQAQLDAQMDVDFRLQQLLERVSSKNVTRLNQRTREDRKSHRRVVLQRYRGYWFSRHEHLTGDFVSNIQELRVFSRGHGHRNFGRKPRHPKEHRRNHDVAPYHFINHPWDLEPSEDELDEIKAELEEDKCQHFWSKYCEVPLPFTAEEYMPEAYDPEDMRPRTAHEYWPKVYRATALDDFYQDLDEGLLDEAYDDNVEYAYYVPAYY